MREMTSKDIYEIYKILAKIARLNVGDYIEFTKKYNLVIEKPETIVKIFEKYGVRRFQEIRDALPVNIQLFLERKIGEVIKNRVDTFNIIL